MERLVGSNPEIVESVTRMIPLGRYGKISEIADAGLFLFSPAASFVTGQILIVDGGDYHTSSISAFIPYPSFFLEEDKNARSTIAAKL